VGQEKTRTNSGKPFERQDNPNIPRASTLDDEARLIRRLQIMIGMVSSVISQDPTLTVEEASELAAGAKRPASPCSRIKSLPTIFSISRACNGLCASASTCSNLPSVILRV
jgi:hypothetical protein